ncbi:hypothetical protein EDB89DRAFT_1912146 [Lactarius sanguifluus]|nr:hypothetical protein EDB89DRAFT_1912146 [Lactarius sanguifluus]
MRFSLGSEQHCAETAVPMRASDQHDEYGASCLAPRAKTNYCNRTRLADTVTARESGAKVTAERASLLVNPWDRRRRVERYSARPTGKWKHTIHRGMPQYLSKDESDGRGRVNYDLEPQRRRKTGTSADSRGGRLRTSKATVGKSRRIGSPGVEAQGADQESNTNVSEDNQAWARLVVGPSMECRLCWGLVILRLIASLVVGQGLSKSLRKSATYATENFRTTEPKTVVTSNLNIVETAWSFKGSGAAPLASYPGPEKRYVQLGRLHRQGGQTTDEYGDSTDMFANET